jgi:BRCA1 C Terminus (BRCT) domain
MIRPPTRSGPAAPGSKEVPAGHPNALAGLAFVFTGELSAFSREEATELAKRFGGSVSPPSVCGPHNHPLTFGSAGELREPRPERLPSW